VTDGETNHRNGSHAGGFKMTDQRGGPLFVDFDTSGALVVHGDIDIAGGPTLESYVLQLEEGAPLVLDLRDVDFIDSSGLRTLLAASRRAHRSNTSVRLRNVGAAVRRMLEITGTSGQFEIEE
jgi:anti-anti-sigma factor